MTEAKQPYLIDYECVRITMARVQSAQEKEKEIAKGVLPGGLVYEMNLAIPLGFALSAGFLVACGGNSAGPGHPVAVTQTGEAQPTTDQASATNVPADPGSTSNLACHDLDGKAFPIGGGNSGNVKLYQCFPGQNGEEWSEWENDSGTGVVLHWKEDGKTLKPVKNFIVFRFGKTEKAKKVTLKGNKTEIITLVRGDDGHFKVTPPADFQQAATTTPVPEATLEITGTLAPPSNSITPTEIVSGSQGVIVHANPELLDRGITDTHILTDLTGAGNLHVAEETPVSYEVTQSTDYTLPIGVILTILSVSLAVGTYSLLNRAHQNKLRRDIERERIAHPERLSDSELVEHVVELQGRVNGSDHSETFNS